LQKGTPKATDQLAGFPEVRKRVVSEKVATFSCLELASVSMFLYLKLSAVMLV